MEFATVYRISAKSEEAIGRIAAIWENFYDYLDLSEEDGKSFECAEDGGSTVILDLMERIIKLVHEMETSGHKDSFFVV